MLNRHPYHIAYGSSHESIVLARLERGVRAIRPIEQSDRGVFVPMDVWAEVVETSRVAGLVAKESPGGQAAIAVIAGIQVRLKTLYVPVRIAVRIPTEDWEALQAAIVMIAAEPGVGQAGLIEGCIVAGVRPDFEPGDNREGGDAVDQ